MTKRGGVFPTIVDLVQILDSSSTNIATVEALLRVLRLAAVIEWTKVRARGNLQILTRVSYISVLAVPIVAAFWSWFFHYNSDYYKDSVQVRSGFERAIGKLETLTVPSEAFDHIKTFKANELIVQLHSELEQLGETLTEGAFGKSLPIVWVIAFFSALAVIVAHLVYEIFAPDVLRKQSLDDFRSNRLREFRESRSEARIEEAIHIVAEAYELKQSDVRSDLTNQTIDSHEFFFSISPSTVTRSNEVGGGILFEENAKDQNATQIAKERSLLEEASAIEYAYLAKESPIAALSSTMLYLFAILGVVAIVGIQSHTVLAAANLI